MSLGKYIPVHRSYLHNPHDFIKKDYSSLELKRKIIQIESINEPVTAKFIADVLHDTEKEEQISLNKIEENRIELNYSLHSNNASGLFAPGIMRSSLVVVMNSSIFKVVLRMSDPFSGPTGDGVGSGIGAVVSNSTFS